MSYKENLILPKPDGCGAWPPEPDGHKVWVAGNARSYGFWMLGNEPEDIPDTDGDESVKGLFHSKLRAELKLEYYMNKRYSHGMDLKPYWNSGAWMCTVKNLTPVMSAPSPDSTSLRPVCNKLTTLYWDVSAQQSGGSNACPSIIFACIYKCWFRYHNNDPDIEFGKFFAHPFRIAQTGPHTIPEILKAHAHLYDRAASDLESIKRGVENDHKMRSRWENFRLLPLFRAIIVLLDESLTLPVFKKNKIVSLDDEVQRRTVVLVLTGFNQGLKSGDLSFDSIRSNALPLARDDAADDSKNVIRVSLKTAVHFIAELQQREERADLNLTSESAPKDHGSTMTTEEEANAYADDILTNASTDPEKASKIKSATEMVRLIDSGRMSPNYEFGHFWGHSYY